MYCVQKFLLSDFLMKVWSNSYNGLRVAQSAILATPGYNNSYS